MKLHNLFLIIILIYNLIETLGAILTKGNWAWAVLVNVFLVIGYFILERTSSKTVEVKSNE